MRYIADIVAKILSVALYPLFVPTYGIALFCYAYGQTGRLPFVWSLIAILGTLFFTCLLPILTIWILMRRGTVKDFEIENAAERRLPYFYCALDFAFWTYFMIDVLNAPLCIGFITLGATVAIALVSFINRRWKISAHLTGIGGLVGGVFAYCLEVSAIPTVGTIGTLLGISLLLMYARLHLNAHTPAQVCAGWLLGIICTFLPYAIYAVG